MHAHDHGEPKTTHSRQIVGYCVKCQARRELREPRQIERAGGPAIEGLCAECSAKMFIMGGELERKDS